MSHFFAPLSLPFAMASDLVWGAIVPWVATGLLGVPAPPLTSDGDGLAQWIVTGGCLAFAGLVTAVWSYVGRARTEYMTLHAWLRVMGRYVLGIAMVVYGLARIFHLQMLPPHLAKLVQPLGESSLTSLLWIFMGSSAAYSAFTGFVELLGGVLLFNRRTAARTRAPRRRWLVTTPGHPDVAGSPEGTSRIKAPVQDEGLHGVPLDAVVLHRIGCLG